MLGDTSTRIRVVKAGPDDLVDLSDFIKPFVASGDLLPRTFDELEDLLETSFIARLDGRIVGCARSRLQQEALRDPQPGGLIPQRRVGHRQAVGGRLRRTGAARGHLRDHGHQRAEDFFKSCGFDFTLPNLKKAFFLQTRDEM